MSSDFLHEDQTVPSAYYTPGTLQQEHDTAQNVWLVPHTATNRAPLQENRQQVMLELIRASPTGERLGLDLVAVLDVSGSMTIQDRLNKMKTAMQFVIKKLSPIDRLSIVTFSNDAERLCHLRSVTQASQAHLKDLVDRLEDKTTTNIQAGLEAGLKVLNDRRIAGGRVASIFLLSDGEQNISDATIVDVSDVAVYTFGFVADSNHKVLGEIAMKSKGGTFNFVEDGEIMSEPFSQILGGLLSIVVQDLKLTVYPKPGDSTIEKVNAGLYPQTRDTNTGSVTVSFGDLFAAEVRNIMIDVLLPAVHRSRNVTAIIASCTYSINGKPFVSREFTVTIRRTGSADPSSPKSEAVRTPPRSRKPAEDHEKDPTKVPPPASQDVEQAKILVRRDQQAIKRPPAPAVVETSTAWSWRTWWGDWESHHERSRWAWAMVILCTVLTIAVIVIGVTS